MRTSQYFIITQHDAVIHSPIRYTTTSELISATEEANAELLNCIGFYYWISQVLATLYLREGNAVEDDARQERVLVDIHLPETRQMQYHVANFARSKLKKKNPCIF